MNNLSWKTILGFVLVFLSTGLYLMHYLIFQDAHHILIYLLGDIAFIPLEVLIVTLIIERFLNLREKKQLLNKLNMVIGAFYSEVGTQSLKRLAAADPKCSAISEQLLISEKWDEADYKTIKKVMQNYDYRISMNPGELCEFRAFITEKRGFLLRLLENPNLLEHDSFSELLWAVFHLTDELGAREDIENLNKEDYDHLINDYSRAYKHLALEWLDYMKHLRFNYPFLFSFAMRTNPFDPKAQPEIHS